MTGSGLHPTPRTTDVPADKPVRISRDGEREGPLLLSSGQVRCWGDNASGQLGDDNPGVDSAVPVAVRNVVDSAALRNVSSVAQSGGAHGCAVLANQQVRCWGDNDNGQLGNDDLGNDSGLPVVVHLS